MPNLWDEMYEDGTYQRRWDSRGPSQELVAVLATLNLASGGCALDIGCGAGTEAIFLARTGFHVIGLELSKRALEIARSRAVEAGAAVEWTLGSALEIPIADSSIDFANDRGCFHLIPPHERAKFASEVARVLKPGGRLLLRGCRKRNSSPFVVVDEATVDEYFSSEQFSRGPVLSLELMSNQTMLKSNIVVLRRLPADGKDGRPR